MISSKYPLQYDEERYYLESGRYTWNEILDVVLSFDKHIDLQINKWQLPKIPDHFEKRFADNDGQDEDYGHEEEDGRSIHVKVYDQDDIYRIHWDAKDPKSNPIGHLIHDAPHWAALLGGVVLLGGYALYKKNKKK